MAIFNKDLEAKLLVHFAEDDRRFSELKELAPAVRETNAKLQTVTDKLEKKEIAEEAVAEVTEKAAEETKQAAKDAKIVADKQISKRQYVITTIITTTVGVASVGAIVWSALAVTGQL